MWKPSHESDRGYQYAKGVHRYLNNLVGIGCLIVLLGPFVLLAIGVFALFVAVVLFG